MVSEEEKMLLRRIPVDDPRAVAIRERMAQEARAREEEQRKLEEGKQLLGKIPERSVVRTGVSPGFVVLQMPGETVETATVVGKFVTPVSEEEKMLLRRIPVDDPRAVEIRSRMKEQGIAEVKPDLEPGPVSKKGVTTIVDIKVTETPPGYVGAAEIGKPVILKAKPGQLGGLIAVGERYLQEKKSLKAEYIQEKIFPVKDVKKVRVIKEEGVVPSPTVPVEAVSFVDFESLKEVPVKFAPVGVLKSPESVFFAPVKSQTLKEAEAEAFSKLSVSKRMVVESQFERSVVVRTGKEFLAGGVAEAESLFFLGAAVIKEPVKAVGVKDVFSGLGIREPAPVGDIIKTPGGAVFLGTALKAATFGQRPLLKKRVEVLEYDVGKVGEFFSDLKVGLAKKKFVAQERIKDFFRREPLPVVRYPGKEFKRARLQLDKTLQRIAEKPPPGFIDVDVPTGKGTFQKMLKKQEQFALPGGVSEGQKHAGALIQIQSPVKKFKPLITQEIEYFAPLPKSITARPTPAKPVPVVGASLFLLSKPLVKGKISVSTLKPAVVKPTKQAQKQFKTTAKKLIKGSTPTFRKVQVQKQSIVQKQLQKQAQELRILQKTFQKPTVTQKQAQRQLQKQSIVQKQTQKQIQKQLQKSLQVHALTQTQIQKQAQPAVTTFKVAKPIAKPIPPALFPDFKPKRVKRRKVEDFFFKKEKRRRGFITPEQFFGVGKKKSVKKKGKRRRKK